MASADVLTDMARELCRKWPDAPARTLARRLAKASNGALTIEQARSRIARQFGVWGKQSRKKVKPSVPRQPRAAGQVYAMPASIAEPWTPHRMDLVGTVGILSDIHVPYHSERAVSAAVGYLRQHELAGLVLNGDVCDFYAISRYLKDPTQRDFKGELEAVRQFLGWIRHQFPGIPIVLKAGNHEERWKHWLWQHAPEIADEPVMSLTGWLRLGEHDITLVEDQRPIMVGKLPVFHGHELPRGFAAPVNAARGLWLRLKTSGLAGHHHRTSNHTESDWKRRETAAWSTGCLCDLTPEYSRVNGWNWGFATVTVYAGGDFDVENLRITADGTVRTA